MRNSARIGLNLIIVTAKEMRLALGLLLVLFFTSEIWRLFGSSHALKLSLLNGAMVAATAAIIVVGLRHLIDPSIAPTVQRRIVRRVLGETLTLGIGLALGFVILGMLCTDAEVAAQWSESSQPPLATFSAGSANFALGVPMIKVSSFLASLGMFAFSLEVVTDPDTRETLISDLLPTSATNTIQP